MPVNFWPITRICRRLRPTDDRRPPCLSLRWHSCFNRLCEISIHIGVLLSP